MCAEGSCSAVTSNNADNAESAIFTERQRELPTQIVKAYTALVADFLHDRRRQLLVQVDDDLADRPRQLRGVIRKHVDTQQVSLCRFEDVLVNVFLVLQVGDLTAQLLLADLAATELGLQRGDDLADVVLVNDGPLVERGYTPPKSVAASGEGPA